MIRTVSARGSPYEPSSPLEYGWSGSREQRSGRLLLDDAAGIHHQDAVGEVEDRADVVADEEHREALLRLEPAHVLEDRVLHDDVEAGGRLVEEDELRVEGQGQREVDALLHAAGELVREGAR